MKVIVTTDEEQNNLLVKVLQCDNQEKIATATVTSETLKNLNISIENLPQKCQQLLQQAAETQASSDANIFDPVSVTLHHTKVLSESLNQEYEVLKLKQKNRELQAKIEQNDRFLEDLKRELQSSKDSLSAQNPNPDSIAEHLRQLKQKVASYEESCEKTKAKFAKLSVPEGVMPNSLMSLVTTLATLRDEAATLQQRADDVRLAREARDTFNRLRR